MLKSGIFTNIREVLKHNKLFLLIYLRIFGEQFLSWMGDLKELHDKPKVSIADINDFIFKHPAWAASVIRNALGSEMYRVFCSYCENFTKCCEKLGVIKTEMGLGCICNEFLNKKYSENNRHRLRAYLKEVIVSLDY